MAITATEFKFSDGDTILRLRLVQRREEETGEFWLKWRYCVEMYENQRATKARWRCVFRLHEPNDWDELRYALKSRWGRCPMTLAAWRWAHGT